MEDSDRELIRRLCSRAGEIMEDASVIGIIWDAEDGVPVEERLDKLALARRWWVRRGCWRDR